MSYCPSDTWRLCFICSSFSFHTLAILHSLMYTSLCQLFYVLVFLHCCLWFSAHSLAPIHFLFSFQVCTGFTLSIGKANYNVRFSLVRNTHVNVPPISSEPQTLNNEVASIAMSLFFNSSASATYKNCDHQFPLFVNPTLQLHQYQRDICATMAYRVKFQPLA